jgi:hypothetical protein
MHSHLNPRTPASQALTHGTSLCGRHQASCTCAPPTIHARSAAATSQVQATARILTPLCVRRGDQRLQGRRGRTRCRRWCGGTRAARGTCPGCSGAPPWAQQPSGTSSSAAAPPQQRQELTAPWRHADGADAALTRTGQRLLQGCYGALPPPHCGAPSTCGGGGARAVHGLGRPSISNLHDRKGDSAGCAATSLRQRLRSRMYRRDGSRACCTGFWFFVYFFAIIVTNTTPRLYLLRTTRGHIDDS